MKKSNQKKISYTKKTDNIKSKKVSSSINPKHDYYWKNKVKDSTTYKGFTFYV